MMVTFVSQCEKKALKKTRKVLDAFANRIGDNTWQTLITQDGLETVHGLLKKSASRSTAVSCHWIRSRSRTQLLWVVGNKNKFNQQGYVPVNRTEKDLMQNEYEGDWKYLPLIKAITGMAALFHDWGKASALFQKKLDPKIKTKFKGDPLRHEWVSCLLFSQFVHLNENNDETWLQAIMDGDLNESQFSNETLTSTEKPLSHLPDAASLISWLIVSHHRLPLPQEKEECKNLRDKTNGTLQELLTRIEASWGYENRYDDFEKLKKQCFAFPQGLLSKSDPWRKQLQHRACDLLHHLPLLEQAMNDGSWRLILHHARLCLMLGDHYYSSKPKNEQWQSPCSLFANTDRATKELKQKLDEHLFHVEDAAVNAVNMLPFFESEPLVASDLEALKPQKNTEKKFKWQDNTVTKINAWREKTQDKSQGYFVVNMASTGTGKTIANAKVMQALSEDKASLRFILALGLRTLTLQTGEEYKIKLNLKSSDLAVLIGSKTIYRLHTDGGLIEKDNQEEEDCGSQSIENLQEESDELHWGEEKDDWQGVLPEEELATVLTCEKDRKLLYAPVLACTIDHIMAATETKRGGRYILPCLRLMSSDLVIDEIDDFTGDDLIAIGRLVHLAGMLGRKVMISSATVPPDLALGFYNAYRLGWAMFAASRERNAQVNCVWIDEFNTEMQLIGSEESDIEAYQASHARFVNQRVAILKEQVPKRKADIFLCPKSSDLQNVKTLYFEYCQQAVLKKHALHFTQDEQSQIKVSFGVMRVANISLCAELTPFFLDCDWPENTEIRCMAYHSQQVLLLRHEQEKHLDEVLKRKEKPEKSPEAFANPVIRQHLQECKAKNLIFILVATPVEEVGRDHDFDWAVLEPSSYRSFVQMGGRVRRHRDGGVETPNISLMQYNLKGFEGKQDRVFCQPGYETRLSLQLSSHDLTQLVDETQLLHCLDAVPRIQKRKDATPKSNLADLEHLATANVLGVEQINKIKPVEPVKQNRFGPRSAKQKPIFWSHHLHGHLTDFWWLTALPQYYKGFRNSEPSVQLYLLIDKNKVRFHQRDDSGEPVAVERILNIVHHFLNERQMSRLWLVRDYKNLISQYTKEGESEYITSFIYGEISLIFRDQNNEYGYNDQLGLVKKARR